MANTIIGRLSAGDAKFAIVAARWNDFITSRLVDGALDAISRHGGHAEAAQIVWVPGSFEIPLAAQRLAASKQFHAIICVGCLIRGQTPHFDYIAAEAAKGIAGTALKFDLPVAFGIVTADTLEQAIDRAGGKHGNKGAEAALAAIEMVNLLEKLAK
ncbi:MAG: 6,7-dimethyl-8-ribityllumazine synthase [Phycisphaerales bacterium]|nr:6,7-dimethyl-8-ribityllumazine synthase [Phycisphaerales bacterium]